MQTKGRLYLLLSLACALGYFWLFWAIQFPNHTTELCIIQQVGNIPCPSCGTTRSVIALMQGNITEAAMLNPLGFLMACVLILLPLGLIRDWIFRKSFLYQAYHKMEQIFRKPYVALPCIALILMNWIWNILKTL